MLAGWHIDRERTLAGRLVSRAAVGLRRLDRLRWQLGVVFGAGAGLLLGVGLLRTGSPWALLGAAAALGGAAALSWSGEPVAELSPLEEPLAMIELPGGTFLMGSPPEEDGRYEDEGPRHRVRVAAFAMARVPVTQRLYREVTGEAKGDPAGDELPVNQVTWLDAVRFCNLLSERVGLAPCYHVEGDAVCWDREVDAYRSEGDSVRWDREADGYRLPTEAEWEYAARAGSKKAYCYGGDVKRLGEYAWHRESSERQPRPVRTKKANRFGLHDIHGNVWEWCWDWYDSYKVEEDDNPVGPPTGDARVVRGGSFACEPRNVRSANRFRVRSLDWIGDVGFRCVRGSGRQPYRR